MSDPIKRSLWAFAVLLSAVTSAGPASAATCTFTVSSVNFGAYNAQSAVALDGTGTITIACSGGTPPGVTLGLGKGGSATYTPRRVAAGANIITYNLYTSAARTIIWGDGTSSTAIVPVAGPGTFTIYGRVPAGQKVPVGSYSDTVVVTLSF